MPFAASLSEIDVPTTLEFAGAGTTAALVTLFDLDRTFYIPQTPGPRWALRFWWWGFILANGVLAVLLHAVVRDWLVNNNWFDSVPPLRGVLVGTSYLALVRSKFMTLSIPGKDFPVGLEAAYDGARAFVFRRINRIAQEECIKETTALAASKTLIELRDECLTAIETNQLLTLEEKRQERNWVLLMIEDENSNSTDKRRTLANYRLSGQKSRDLR